ncbi:MAG: hypothetical protein ACRD3E_01160 [Terriglobales bacterium]
MANHRTKRKQANSDRSRVIVEFPPELLAAADEAAEELKTNRSTFVRNSVEEAIARVKRAKLEADLAEGCRRDAELDRRLCEEFKYVDAEAIR